MNTLIISTFSCTFDEFKNDVTNLFLKDICKEFVTEYEFVKVNDNKSHLLMNCTDLEKFVLRLLKNHIFTKLKNKNQYLIKACFSILSVLIIKINLSKKK